MERVKHQNKTLLQIPYEKFVFAYVIEGSSFYVKRKLDEFFADIIANTNFYTELTHEAERRSLSAEIISQLDNFMQMFL